MARSEPVTLPATDCDGLELRRAERADLLAVFRIESASFPQPWPYDAFERFLGTPGFLVAELDRQVVGYVIADVVRNHGSPVGHVKDLAVHPDRRGLGVGSSLLSAALSAIATSGARSVRLEVRESNAPARRLYRRFGFDPLRRVSDYYDDGEDALVMVRELPADAGDR